MSKTSKVHFANFICRFGDFTLLDFAEEVVIPAFLKGIRRKYGNAQYLIKDCELIDIGTPEEPDLALAGRIVNDTIVWREQYLDGNVLVKDRAEMSSAPSAVFVLMLDTHRLIYVPETSGAPSLSSFRATVYRGIRDQRQRVLELEKRRMAASGKSATLKYLSAKIPDPSLDVVPLSSQGSVTDFLAQFSILRSVNLALLKPNDDIDIKAWLNDTRGVGENFGAAETSVSYVNRSGLDLGEAKAEIQEIAAVGNTRIKLAGDDMQGDRLTGNNETFKVSVPVEALPNVPAEAAPKLIQIFRSKVQEGLIHAPKVSKAIREGLRRIRGARSRLME